MHIPLSASNSSRLHPENTPASAASAAAEIAENGASGSRPSGEATTPGLFQNNGQTMKTSEIFRGDHLSTDEHGHCKGYTPFFNKPQWPLYE